MQMKSAQPAVESTPPVLDNSPSDSHADITLILTRMHNNANIEPTNDDLEESNAEPLSDSNDLQESNENRRKVGRPKSTNGQKKKHVEVAATTFLNEVAVKNAEEKVPMAQEKLEEGKV